MTEFDLTKKGMTVGKAYALQRDAGEYSEIFKTYRDPMTKYAFAVLEGKQVAGEKIRLACFRHLQDLLRQDTDDFPYHYDLDVAHRILNFAAICPDVDTGEPLPLMLWQQAALCDSQAWRDKNDERRFHYVVFSVARTNGKTYLTNILLAYDYIVASQGLYNQDLGYVAPIGKQSQKGFRYIKLTFIKLEQLGPFKKMFKAEQIKPLDDIVRSKKTMNQLVRLSHESGQLDSYHFRLIVSDEAGDDQHISKISANNEKATTGQVQTADSQFWQISTAYPNDASPFYKDETMVAEAMRHDDQRELDDYLALVWEQDGEAEMQKPETWEKSNPVLALPDKHDSMLASLISERDKSMATGKVADFLNKNLNIWLTVKQNSYIEKRDIDMAVVDEPPIDITGRDVYLGWDLSHFSDDTAIAAVFPYEGDDGEPAYFIMEHSWVPTARAQTNIAVKEKQDGINYRAAEQLGFATVARNRFGLINEEEVYTWLLDFVEQSVLKVKYFCYDAWATNDIVSKLDKLTDWRMMPIRQGTQSLDHPTTKFRELMIRHRVQYLNDPIIKYALGNAILKQDNNGVKVDKDRATAKIDFVDATIDAMYRAIWHYSDAKPDDDKKDKSPFAGMDNEDINQYFKNDFGF